MVVRWSATDTATQLYPVYDAPRRAAREQTLAQKLSTSSRKSSATKPRTNKGGTRFKVFTPSGLELIEDSSGSSESDYELEVPDVLPARAATSSSRSSRTAGDWERIEVPGGFLRFSKTLARLDAHCSCHHCAGRAECKSDRAFGNPGDEALQDRRAQGCRCLGRQLLWLKLGATMEYAQHKTLKKSVGGHQYRQQRLTCRREFAARATSEPLVAEILRAERRRADHESEDEPLSVP
jgi:hypothetical protein